MNGEGIIWKEGPSLIEGRGCFACKDMEIGEEIGKAVTLNGITRMGSFINHQTKSNSILKNKGSFTWMLVAIRKIKMGEEITSDYRKAPPFIKRPAAGWRELNLIEVD